MSDRPAGITAAEFARGLARYGRTGVSARDMQERMATEQARAQLDPLISIGLSVDEQRTLGAVFARFLSDGMQYAYLENGSLTVDGWVDVSPDEAEIIHKSIPR